jgi:hypothetical protein
MRYFPLPETGIHINLVTTRQADLGYPQKVSLQPTKGKIFEQAKCKFHVGP